MSGINAKPERLIDFDQALTYADYYRVGSYQVAKLAPKVILPGPSGPIFTLPSSPLQPERFPARSLQNTTEYTFGDLSGNFKYIH